MQPLALLDIHTQRQATQQAHQGRAGQHPQDTRQVWPGQHTQEVAEGPQRQGQATRGQAGQVEGATSCPGCLAVPVVAAHHVGDGMQDSLQGILRHVDGLLLLLLHIPAQERRWGQLGWGQQVGQAASSTGCGTCEGSQADTAKGSTSLARGDNGSCCFCRAGVKTFARCLPLF